VSVTAHGRFELIHPSKSRHVSPRGGFLFCSKSQTVIATALVNSSGRFRLAMPLHRMGIAKLRGDPRFEALVQKVFAGTR